MAAPRECCFLEYHCDSLREIVVFEMSEKWPRTRVDVTLPLTLHKHDADDTMCLKGEISKMEELRSKRRIITFPNPTCLSMYL